MARQISYTAPAGTISPQAYAKIDLLSANLRQRGYFELTVQVGIYNSELDSKSGAPPVDSLGFRWADRPASLGSPPETLFSDNFLGIIDIRAKVYNLLKLVPPFTIGIDV